MESTPSQDTEDNHYLCFQRTPSLRRKWRKRYGGLDGNKLLEPNKEDDMKENVLQTEPQQRNAAQMRSTERQDAAPPGHVQSPISRNTCQPQSQRPVSFVSPGPTGLLSLVSNGALKPPLPQTPAPQQERPVTSPQPWPGGVGRAEQERPASSPQPWPGGVGRAEQERPVTSPQPWPGGVGRAEQERPASSPQPWPGGVGRAEQERPASSPQPWPGGVGRAEQERPASSPQPWPGGVGRAEPQQGHSKRRAAADVLFDSFASDGRLNMNQFFEAVWTSGLHRSDPRIKDCYFHMRKLQDADGTVDRNTFQRCVTGFVSLILKALQGRFIIPDFSTFTEQTQKLFIKCKQLSSIKKDSGDSAKWGVSVCTVDGQRLSLGDWDEPWVLAEVSWPLIYGIAADQLGAEHVHRYLGVEEFSKYSSPFTLTKQGVPHSPLIETGAIIATSLLQLAGKLCAEEEEKYESVLNVIRRLCNKEHANLNCTSYQSLRKDSIRLHSLSFYLQEKKCFPETVDISATLDLLLQCASTEVTCESGAAIAASLANGGLCPLSGDQVLSPSTTRSMLSVMQVAGMNDYSRMFHFKTSAPAQSSRSGAVLAVIPGVLGLTCCSPDLDSFGNSWRAVHFIEELISTFQLHSFDIRTPFRQVLTYRQWKAESEGYQIMNVLLAAFKGDLPSLRRYFLSGVDMNAVDYDGRSALHVAASEGHAEVIHFLVENTGANYSLKDRWGNTPLQEAMRHSHGPAAQILQKYEEHVSL